MVDLYVIVGLFFVILAEFFFLYYYMEKEERERKRLLDELSKANAAIVSKSAQEYVMMRSMDQVRAEEKPAAPEAADSSELTDEEYDKMIKEQLRVG